jgi:hypothetical protein
MTVSTTQTSISYTGDGATVAFSYPFLILESNDLEVRLNGVVTGAYTVSGVGSPGGGLVTFTTAPASGVGMTITRFTDLTQLTDYDFSASAPFSGSSHEAALDKLTLIVQDLKRQVDVLAPGASAISYGQNAVTVNTSNGASSLTATAAFPAGVIKLGAIVRVVTTFGNANGLTTFKAGDGTVTDRWGSALARTATVAPTGANTPANFLPLTAGAITAAAENVVLTATAGTFDATGQAIVTACFLRLGAT